MLQVLLDNVITCDSLFAACSIIAVGKLPEQTISLLAASRLIAIPKKNGDVCSIAIGESLMHFAAEAICSELKQNM